MIAFGGIRVGMWQRYQINDSLFKVLPGNQHRFLLGM